MNDQFDFLVIGSGIAGLSYALQVADHGRTAIITKKEATESNTNYAQGGIASVMSGVDSFDAHLHDTLTAGAGLCHREVAEMIITAGPDCIRRLVEIGVAFTRSKTKEEFSLGREGGHSFNRVVHAADLTGREIERALLSACQEHKNITILADHIAVDLITSDQDGRPSCGGAFVFDPEKNRRLVVGSAITMLCTGGVGQVYRYTTNPKIATGDGIAMAYRAGAAVANLEFMQFHPTTLSLVGRQPFLISEAVRGEGGLLRTADGVAFMEKYHSSKDLAPRDIVARAIDTELKKSGDETVFLDIRHIPSAHIKTRFPNIYINCLENGIDITRDLIPVVPAAHYMCGGVQTDVAGRTNIAKLYVCGEAACTGMHGANRLASNSLLEAVATAQFGAEKSIADYRTAEQHGSFQTMFPHPEEAALPPERVLLSHNRRELKRLMWDHVGIVRSRYRLEEAVERIGLIKHSVDRYYSTHALSYYSIELRNMATVAELIITCALARRESRGLHFIVDYPQTDDQHWKKDTVIMKGKFLDVRPA